MSAQSQRMDEEIEAHSEREIEAWLSQIKLIGNGDTVRIENSGPGEYKGRVVRAVMSDGVKTEDYV